MYLNDFILKCSIVEQILHERKSGLLIIPFQKISYRKMMGPDQGFIQALLLTPVFHEGLSFIDVGHKPACVSTLTPAAMGSRGCCKSHFDYFSNPRFSNSLSIKTQNGKSCEHITVLKQGIKSINAEFIRTCALCQLSFNQFRSYATLFLEPLLSLTLISKSKKTLQTSLDLTSSLKTSVDW